MEDHTEETQSQESAKRSFESFNDAFQRGKEDAFSKAEEAAPKLKEAIASAAFEAAYGIAFGAFFASAFAKEVVPENVKEGLKKGANAGKRAAQDMKGGFAETQASASEGQSGVAPA